jgi:hypothetical protein
VVAQPGGIYGFGDHTRVGPLLARAVRVRLVLLPLGNVGLSWAHVDDAAAGILLAHDHGRVWETYILGGEVATLRQAVDKGVRRRRSPTADRPGADGAPAPRRTAWAAARTQRARDPERLRRRHVLASRTGARTRRRAASWATPRAGSPKGSGGPSPADGFLAAEEAGERLEQLGEPAAGSDPGSSSEDGARSDMVAAATGIPPSRSVPFGHAGV